MVSGPWHWLRVLVSPGLSNYLILPFWSAIILSLHKCLLLAYWKFWDEPMHVWCVNHLWRRTINLNWISTSLFVILSKKLNSLKLNIANNKIQIAKFSDNHLCRHISFLEMTSGKNCQNSTISCLIGASERVRMNLFNLFLIPL